MTLREKILVGLMIAAVALGAVSLWSGGPDGTLPGGSGAAAPPLTQMLTKLTGQFDKGTSLQTSRYTLDVAQTPWPDALFLEDALLSTAGRMPGAAEALPANLSLVYAGFIEASGRRVAVINGIEYTVGEQLDQSNYTLHDITPQQVVLRTPQQRMLAIPLADSWEVGPP